MQLTFHVPTFAGIVGALALAALGIVSLGTIWTRALGPFLARPIVGALVRALHVKVDEVVTAEVIPTLADHENRIGDLEAWRRHPSRA